MVSTDPIADMLTRIRNAASVGKTELVLPYSKNKETIAKILVASGFLADVKGENAAPAKLLTIKLADEGQQNRITEIVRVSRPGRRLYAKADEIPVVKRGRGIMVVSTSAGIMTGDQARSKRLGGELICKVY